MIPFIDRGDPINWPFYKHRVRMVKRHPFLYKLIWWDWR